MANLPVCAVRTPACGSCGGDTEASVDGIYCDPCGLYYGNGDDCTEATFLDDAADPCAQPCSNHWHGDHKIRQGWGYECTPCQLPARHTSDCWTDCIPYKLEENTNG